MATSESNTRRDGQYSFIGGSDTLTHPMLLPNEKVAYAVNAAFRGGFLGQRPGFTQKALTFRKDSYADWFKTATVQGWGVYRSSNNVEAIIALSGRIFACDLTNLEVYERTPTNKIEGASDGTIPAVGSTIDVTFSSVSGLEVGHPVLVGNYNYEYKITATSGTTITLQNVSDTRVGDDFNSQLITHLLPAVNYADQAWMIQAEQYFIIQDGISKPVILDGPNNRHAEASQKEIPAGKQMAYGRGRLWIAVNDNEVIAGDIIGGGTGILKVTENDYLNEGGTFRIPDANGPIRAMKFINTLDDSLGQGPLLVGTSGGIFSLNAPTDRDTWKDLRDPIQTYALLNYGIESQDSVTLVNGDLFYRSKDGWRSFILARRDFNTWGNVPLSSEMHKILLNDDEKLIKYSSAILFDNRLLFTVNPQLFRNRPYFRGIGSLDFAPISSMGQKGRPAYDNLWTGIQPAGLFKADIDNEERAFSWVINADNHVELWEISKRKEFDGVDGRIKTSIESKSFLFGSPYELLRLVRGELYLDNVKGDVDFTISYRPDGAACWESWGTFSLCQQYRQCSAGAEACNSIVVYQPGYRTRIKLSEPSFETNNSSKHPTRDFYTVQVKIEWTGCARLLRYVLIAETTIEDTGFPDNE